MTNTAAVIHTAKRALRAAKVLEKTGMSRTHLYRLIQRGDFPAPSKLSERISIWDESAIDDWLADKFGGV